ncbi:bis(5'-nucleosyl)-tetraphosphatase (symmetrical) [Litorivivens lipolytica]|uniref:bis(5'-nucleosyl)-tetraphosphatase (symmetrical) n=1 Tax=Litorivivens lipolytica TaxID=1524264 RepID=A0A7W4W622_9GAMM|nr:symmetrical bis(5'-nucleosyl)-tetraphosphatase [Litorivivens lipolytica]MBB3048127.1 bis(5'-nucleosyl)-tetraphosphatase (symmetrical) [Litorivivens lipolytica]
MGRYAVGDLQGCLEPLQCLLEEVAFNPSQDELWLVGDLVNRGPHSLEVLDFLYPIRHALTVVLGNHDLHTLALARGATTQGRHASLESLLSSTQLPAYMDWFRELPLCVRSNCGEYLMSHAGVPSQWSTEDALGYSAELQAVLSEDQQVDAFLQNMYGNEPACWNDGLQGFDRLRMITNTFTRMRVTRQNGELNLKYKGRIEDIPDGYAPWFTWPTASPRRETQLFGHWAALDGKLDQPGYIPLDTGCVWGRYMTLLDMDSREFHRCHCEPAQ